MALQAADSPLRANRLFEGSQGLEAWAESYCPFGTKNHHKHSLTSHHWGLTMTSSVPPRSEPFVLALSRPIAKSRKRSKDPSAPRSANGGGEYPSNPTAIHESIQVQANGAVSRRGESTIVEKGAQRVSPDSFGDWIYRRDWYFCANRNRRCAACRAGAGHLLYNFRGRLPLCWPLLR
jgi:hypothetical protein